MASGTFQQMLCDYIADAGGLGYTGVLFLYHEVKEDLIVKWPRSDIDQKTQSATKTILMSLFKVELSAVENAACCSSVAVPERRSRCVGDRDGFSRCGDINGNGFLMKHCFVAQSDATNFHPVCKNKALPSNTQAKEAILRQRHNTQSPCCECGEVFATACSFETHKMSHGNRKLTNMTCEPGVKNLVEVGSQQECELIKTPLIDKIDDQLISQQEIMQSKCTAKMAPIDLPNRETVVEHPQMPVSSVECNISLPEKHNDEIVNQVAVPSISDNSTCTPDHVSGTSNGISSVAVDSTHCTTSEIEPLREPDGARCLVNNIPVNHRSRQMAPSSIVQEDQAATECQEKLAQKHESVKSLVTGESNCLNSNQTGLLKSKNYADVTVKETIVPAKQLMKLPLDSTNMALNLGNGSEECEDKKTIRLFKRSERLNRLSNPDGPDTARTSETTSSGCCETNMIVEQMFKSSEENLSRVCDAYNVVDSIEHSKVKEFTDEICDISTEKHIPEDLGSESEVQHTDSELDFASGPISSTEAVASAIKVEEVHEPQVNKANVDGLESPAEESSGGLNILDPSMKTEEPQEHCSDSISCTEDCEFASVIMTVSSLGLPETVFQAKHRTDRSNVSLNSREDSSARATKLNVAFTIPNGDSTTLGTQTTTDVVPVVIASNDGSMQAILEKTDSMNTDSHLCGQIAHQLDSTCPGKIHFNAHTSGGDLYKMQSNAQPCSSDVGQARLVKSPEMYSCNSESYATKQNGNATVRMSKPCISESKDTIRNYLPEKSNSKNAAGKIWEEDVATRVFGRTTSSSIKRSSLRSRQNHSSWEKLAKTDDEMHSPSCKTAVNHVSFYRRSKRSAANVRHECDMCQRSFPLVASLKRHAKTHQTRKESSSKVRRRKNHKGKKAKKSRFVFNRGLSTTSIAFAKSSLKDNFHKRDSGSKVRHGASHRLQSATEQMQPDGAKSNCDKLYKTRGKIREVSLSGSTNDVTQNLMTQKKRKEYLPTKVVLERVNYDSSPISIGQKRYGPRQIQGQQDKQERFSHYLEDSNQEESTLPSQTLNKPELQTSSMPKRQVARDTSSNESVVRTQETGKHNISSHECHAFPASFQQECLLQEHINSHDAFESRAKVSTSTDPIHICQHCKMRFTSEESMVTHQHEVHPNQLSTLFVDSGINKGFYSCELCTKPFSSLSCLFNHVSTHQTTIKQHEKRHRCKKCSLSFTLSYTLRKHMEMHHAVTNFFYCVYCCFSTCVRSQYERHTTLHKTLALDVIRPYRSFDFSSLLKYYECCRCSREFFKKSWFEFHMMKCTQPKITLRSCTLCTKWFATQKDLDRHVMTHSDVSKLSTEPNTDLNVLTFPE